MNNILLSLLVINLSSKVSTQFINSFNNNEMENRENFEFVTSEILNLNNNVQEPDIREKRQDGTTQQYISKVVQDLDTINQGSTDSIDSTQYSANVKQNPNIHFQDSTVSAATKTFVSTQYSTNDVKNSNVINQNQINNNPQKSVDVSQNSSNYTKKPNPFFKRASENNTKTQLESNSNIKKPNPFFNRLSENYKELPKINLTNSKSTVNSSLNSNDFNHYHQYYKGWSSFETLYEQIQNLIKPQLEYGKSLEYATPYIPEPDFYQHFFNIYNFVENQQTEDLSQYEMESINDDFNGRSIVAPGQYPHMAAVGFLSNEDQIEFKCGGSLISDSFIITAAHCCYLNGDTPVLVKLGIINLKDHMEDYTPQNRPISEILIHPFYNLSMHYHDIALLKLQTPVKFTKFVRPILLWASDDIPYERVFTMGYGSTSFAKAPTNILTELDLSLIPWQKCKKTMPRDEKAPQGIVESQICAKDFEKNRDTCQGDSGGPLQLNLEHNMQSYSIRYYLVGIISYGEFCRGKYPGVYTRISSYSRWIASIVWPDYFQDFE